MPKDVAYGAVITLRSKKAGIGYLHSHNHLYPEGVGSKQQQVTAYAHKDDNNKFLIKKWNEDLLPMESEEWGTKEIEFVRNGDLIRLEHLASGRNIHTHKQPAPVSKKQLQVTGYGEVSGDFGILP